MRLAMVLGIAILLVRGGHEFAAGGILTLFLAYHRPPTSTRWGMIVLVLALVLVALVVMAGRVSHWPP